MSNTKLYERYVNVEITNECRKRIDVFISEAKAKRDYLVNNRLDTVDEYDANRLTVDTIINDMLYGVGFDEDGDYYNGWFVTDEYDTDFVFGAHIEFDPINMTLKVV